MYKLQSIFINNKCFKSLKTYGFIVFYFHLTPLQRCFEPSSPKPVTHLRHFTYTIKFILICVAALYVTLFTHLLTD